MGEIFLFGKGSLMLFAKCLMLMVLVAWGHAERSSARAPGDPLPDVLDPVSVPKFVTDIVKAPTLKRTPFTVDGVEVDFTVHVRQFEQQMLPDGYPKTTVYGYCGETEEGFVESTPGPTVLTEQNKAFSVRFVNELTEPHMFQIDPTLRWANPNLLTPPVAPFLAAGSYPEYQKDIPIVPHFHGAAVRSDSDGHPDAWFTARGQHGYTYNTTVATEANAAVFSFPNVQEPMWSFVHDHARGITRLNANAGMSSLFRIVGPGNATSADGLLPTGEYEIPMAINDQIFLKDGSLFFPSEGGVPNIHPFFVPEFAGQFIVVNGRTWPRVNVTQGWYRFLLLNRANARHFQLSLSNGANFRVISTGHGYIPNSADVPVVTIPPAGRVEVLVDFSSYEAGTEIEMLNEAGTPFPFGDPVDPEADGKVLKFIVMDQPGFRRGESVAAPEYPVPDVLDPEMAPVRTRSMTLMELEEGGEPLAALLNGLEYNAPVSEQPAYGSVEEWELINLTGDAHPIHFHLVTFLVAEVQRISVASYAAAWEAANGPLRLGMQTATEVSAGDYGVEEPRLPGPQEQGWLDIVIVPPGHVLRVRVRFSLGAGHTPVPFPFDPTVGPGYGWHCHVLDHQDNSMMRPMHIIRYTESNLTGPDYGSEWVIKDEFQLRWKTQRDQVTIGASVLNAGWFGIGFALDDGGVDWMILDANVSSASSMMANKSDVTVYDMFSLPDAPDVLLMDRTHGGMYDVEFVDAYYEQDGRLVANWNRPWTTPDVRDANVDLRGHASMYFISGPGRFEGRPARSRDGSIVGLRIDSSAAVQADVQFGVYERKPIKVAHVVLMSLAFGAFVLFGTLTSTFAPASVVRLWFPIHVLLQVVAMALMIAGFGCIVWYVQDEGDPHFILPEGTTRGAHGILGLILFILMFVQAFLGVLSDTLWRIAFKKSGELPTPKVIPEKVHWWLGRSIVVLGAVVIFLGIAEYYLPYWVYGIFIAWYGVLALVLTIIFIFNYRKLREALEQTEQTARAETIINEDDGSLSHDTDDDISLVPLNAAAPEEPADAPAAAAGGKFDARKASAPATVLANPLSTSAVRKSSAPIIRKASE